MDITQIGTVLGIVIIAYLIGMGAKASPIVDNDNIPVIVGVAGGILGVVGMFVMPDFPANNIIDAIAVGIVSGLASTGVNQVYKKFSD